MKSDPTVNRVYRCLLRRYGPRHWWPAQSPFEVMVGAILTQNTNWANVERALENLRCAQVMEPDLIMAAHTNRLRKWLRPAGYFNVKTNRLRNLCRWLLDQGGIEGLRFVKTPALRRSLLSIHGVGRETADDILLYALSRPVFVVDAYTRRIFSRLGVIRGDEDYEELRRLFESAVVKTTSVYNEYHALIVFHGKSICRPRPLCEDCCIRGICSFPGVQSPK